MSEKLSPTSLPGRIELVEGGVEGVYLDSFSVGRDGAWSMGARPKVFLRLESPPETPLVFRLDFSGALVTEAHPHLAFTVTIGDGPALSHRVDAGGPFALEYPCAPEWIGPDGVVEVAFRIERPRRPDNGRDPRKLGIRLRAIELGQAP